ncbi:MAG: hypothetical protein ACRD3Q_14680 [Terriglobales bacterium]
MVKPKYGLMIDPVPPSEGVEPDIAPKRAVTEGPPAVAQLVVPQATGPDVPDLPWCGYAWKGRKQGGKHGATTSAPPADVSNFYPFGENVLTAHC